jgi:hypothetical protein
MRATELAVRGLQHQELPNVTGIFRIQRQGYDKMGRIVQQTNPTEADASWVPVAEDVSGWGLIATAHVVKQGRTVGLVECDITGEKENLVARASSTCMTLRMNIQKDNERN